MNCRRWVLVYATRNVQICRCLIFLGLHRNFVSFSNLSTNLGNINYLKEIPSINTMRLNFLIFLIRYPILEYNQYDFYLKNILFGGKISLIFLGEIVNSMLTIFVLLLSLLFAFNYKMYRKCIAWICAWR